ncbi:FtsX-like permease family protein [Microbacterium sp. AK009]|uniref:FtsX-like permease family protein n=1 Tax=Microbacterium sp. AK009 TaxID=2723068 RepID=UPI001C5495F8|nr:FtsX-like permease family protein [Microbacterium sp. AK009]
MSTAGLLARIGADRLGATLLVALLVAVTAFAAAVIPRVTAALATAELHSALDALPPPVRDIRAAGTIGLVPGIAGQPIDRLTAPTDAAVQAFADELPPPLRALVGDPQWVVRTEPRDTIPVHTGTDAGPGAAPRPRFLAGLAVDPGWRERVEIVEGAAPAPWSGDETTPAPDPVLEIAVAVETATAADVGVGDVLTYGPFELRVAGLYHPLDAADRHWAHLTDLAGPVVESTPGEVATVRAAVIIDTAGLGGLTTSFTTGTFLAYYPVSASPLRAVDAPESADQLRRALAQGLVMPYGGDVSLATLSADEIDAALARTATVTALLAFALSGLLGLVLAVFTLGVSAVVRVRRPVLALTGARGASGAQLRGAMAGEGLLLAVPAATAATVLAAVAVPEPVGASGWVLPLLVTAAVPVLFAVLASPGNLTAERRDLSPRSGRRRLVIDVAVGLLALVSVLLVAQRGIAGAADAVALDPLLIAAPVLVMAAISLLALRLAPLPLQLLLRRAHRGDRPAPLLGAARAIRAPVFGFAASFALILGVAVVVFSAVFGSTLRTAIVAGAREDVGGDILVIAPAIPPSVRSEVARVPGVEAAAAIAEIPGVRAAGDSARASLTLIVTDTAALTEVRPDLAGLTGLAEAQAGGIPLLVSEDLAPSLDDDSRIGGARVIVTGTVPTTALPSSSPNWALIDAGLLDVLGRDLPDAEQLVVAASEGTDAAALAATIDEVVRAAVPRELSGGVVTVAADAEVAAALASPLTRGIDAALPWAAGAALALTAVAVVLATVTAARARARTAAVLRIIGADSRQERQIARWEFTPPVLLGLIVGLAAGMALPWVITTVVDLRPFVGGRLAPEVTIDPLPLAVALTAVALAATLTAAVSIAIAARRTPATTLRMGDR